MVDWILAVILLAIVGIAAVYDKSKKKRYEKCIGCPCGADCGKCQGGCENRNSPDHYVTILKERNQK